MERQVGTHSCEVTILSWCHMFARVTFADRWLLSSFGACAGVGLDSFQRRDLRQMSNVYGFSLVGARCSKSASPGKAGQQGAIEWFGPDRC